MANIFQKVLNALKKQNKKMPMGVKIIIYWYGAFVAISFFVYIATWAGMIYYGGAKLSDLLAMIKELISIQAIGAIIAVAKFFVDSDGDGVSDIFENDKKRNA